MARESEVVDLRSAEPDETVWELVAATNDYEYSVDAIKAAAAALGFTVDDLRGAARTRTEIAIMTYLEDLD